MNQALFKVIEIDTAVNKKKIFSALMNLTFYRREF